MLRAPKWLALVAVLILLAGAAVAGTIVRGTKASGGTAFVDGYLATAAEVNTDLDRLYTLVNGNIDTNNINSAAGIVSGQIANDTLLNVDVNSVAAIAVSKLAQTAGLLDADIVGDYSDDAAEQATTSNPKTSDDPTALATHLETEIAQLRYKLHELTVGSSAQAVAAAGGTAALTSWIDGPIRPGNLLYNGGFDVWTSAANAAGDGWVLVQTPNTAATALDKTEGQGEGNGMLITGAGAALEGIKQTVSDLKAGAKYLAIVWVKETVGDTCTLFVEDADTNDLTVVSDAVGDWEVLSGTFQIDAVPTAVVFQLLATADTDACLFKHAGIYEINADPVPRNTVMDFEQSTHDQTVTTVEDVLLATGGAADLEVAVTVPGPGYILTAFGRTSCNANTQANSVVVALERQKDGGGWSKVSVTAQEHSTTSDALDFSVMDAVVNPTPGSLYEYRMAADVEANNCIFNADNIFGTHDLTTELMATLTFAGG